MLVDFENLQTKIDRMDDSVDAITLNIADETTAAFDEQVQMMVKSSTKCKVCKGLMKRVLKFIGKEKNKVGKFHFHLQFQNSFTISFFFEIFPLAKDSWEIIENM